MDQIQKVIDYYGGRESRWGYAFLLQGTKHFGYYPQGARELSMIQAQRLMEDRLAEKLDLPVNSLVLDAGCGEGNVALHLVSKYGLRIRGVDLLDWCVAKAQAKAAQYGLHDDGEFRVMNYEHLSFSEEIFDGVFTMETLVHALDHEAALREFYRVLKPGGRLVLFEYSICNRALLSSEERRLFDMIIEESGMHSLPYFLHGQFPSILERAGFQSVSIQDVTPRVMPMLQRFYTLAKLPYLLVKIMGLERKFINTTAAAVGYPLVLRKDGARYNIVVAAKPEKISQCP